MKKTVLTIDDTIYLIPDDQAKDLTGLLDRIGQWIRLKKKNYSDKELAHDGSDNSPEIRVAIVNEDRIDDGKPKASPVVKEEGAS